MRELFVTREQLTGETGADISLDYYVLVEEARLGEVFCCETYGVRIARTDGTEEASVANITPSTRRIDELMERLVRGGVTPATLRDVVEDWLAVQ